jgi:hypothetical protein
MTRKKISPRLQQAAEKYLSSIGASRADLSEKQWEIVVKHVKTQRMAVLILLIFGVILAGLSFWAFRLGEKGMASIIPEKAHLITFVSKTGEESASINPEDIKNYMKAVVDSYWNCGSSFALAGLFFTYAFITIPLTKRANKKMLEAFISHR